MDQAKEIEVTAELLALRVLAVQLMALLGAVAEGFGHDRQAMFDGFVKDSAASVDGAEFDSLPDEARPLVLEKAKAKLAETASALLAA